MPIPRIDACSTIIDGWKRNVSRQLKHLHMFLCAFARFISLFVTYATVHASTNRYTGCEEKKIARLVGGKEAAPRVVRR